MQTAQAAPPPAPAEPERRAQWLPLLGLLAVIVFVTFGGFLFSGTSAEGSLGTQDVEVGTATPVAAGVTIQPASGWELSHPSEDPAGIVLTDGTGWLLAGVPQGSGTAEELVNFYVATYLEPTASEFSVGEMIPFNAPAGVGMTAAYVGVFEGVAVPIEGQVIGIVSPSGTGVVLDGWAAQGNYSSVGEQVQAMATTVVIP